MDRNPVFDPEILERSVSALRALNQQPNARQAMQLMAKKEETRQAEIQVQRKAKENEKIKIENEERRKNMDKQQEINKHTADYNDTLERKRWSDKLNLQEQSAEKIRKENEESLKRQESLRKETIDFQMKRQADLDEKKIILKDKLRNESFRKNFDLRQNEALLKYELENKGKLQIHQLYLDNIKNGLDYFLNSKNAVWTLAQYSLLVSGAYFLSKNSLSLGFRQLEAILNKPQLVRETSRYSYRNFYMLPINYLKKQFTSNQQKQNQIFHNIVLNHELEQKLQVFSKGLICKKRNDIPLRNFLFYGPPGTGKTLFAKAIAQRSGLHYAVISGGDIEKLGPQAATEIDKLFMWAQSTKAGTIIFIDEAESVFYRRDKHNNSLTSNSLATLLSNTSAQSNKVSLVLATNIPNHLDRAALDRMDAMIEFGFQDAVQRKRMIIKGLNKMCQKISTFRYFLKPWLIFFPPISIKNQLSENFIDQYIVPKLEGFSGRQIDKFLQSLHDESLDLNNSASSGIITEELVTKVMQESLVQFQMREKWSN